MERTRPPHAEDVDISPVDNFRIYREEISRIPLLTEDEKHDLGRQIFQGNCAERLLKNGEFSRQRRFILTGYVTLGEVAQKKMVKGHLRYAVGLVKKYKDRTSSIMDLVSEANIGLMESVKEYDYRKGAFTTYSRFRITKRVNLAFLAEGRDVKLPENILKKRIKKLYGAVDALRNELNREPSIQEISEYLGVNVSKIKKLIIASKYPVSFSSPANKDSDQVLEDKIQEPKMSVESQVEERLLSAKREFVIRKVIEQELTIKEAWVMILRYGLYSGKNFNTLEEIGKALGIKRARVHQLECSGIDKLYEPSLLRLLSKVR